MIRASKIISWLFAIVLSFFVLLMFFGNGWNQVGAFFWVVGLMIFVFPIVALLRHIAKKRENTVTISAVTIQTPQPITQQSNTYENKPEKINNNEHSPPTLYFYIAVGLYVFSILLWFVIIFVLHGLDRDQIMPMAFLFSFATICYTGFLMFKRRN